MEVIKLPFGEEAPPEGDCITITEREDGLFMLNGTALLTCGDTDEADSVSVIGSQPYDTYDEAEQAGIAWASDHCVDRLFISRLPVGVMPGV